MHLPEICHWTCLWSLQSQQQKAAPEAAAGQSEEPVATSHTAEEMIQMLSNPVVPQPGDDEIQLEAEVADDPMHTEIT